MASKKLFSLSNQLIRLVILPLLVAVVLLSSIQIYLFYQSSLASSRQQLDHRIDQILPLLSKAMYDADLETINLIGDSLFQDSNVNYMMVSDQFSRIYLRSRDNNSGIRLDPIIISKPLSYTNNRGQRLLLGNLNIRFNHQGFLTRLAYTGLIVIALGILKFMLPLFALIFFLNRKVQQRLNFLIAEISRSRPDGLSPVSQKKNDPKEIQELISAYNQLQENNYRYLMRQQEAHSKLIERTQEVAEGRESARQLTSMLQNSQKRYRALFHRNVDALLIVESFRLEDEERYRIIDANQAAIDILAQPLEQLIKQDFEVMFGAKPLEHGYYPLDKASLPRSLQQSNIQIELHFNMMLYEKQGLYYVTLRDVSDKIRAEKLEIEASELMNFRQNQMAIAEMATTIAHEVNQPLAAIQNYAFSAINFSQADDFNSDKLHESLEKLILQADIASDIVQQARGQLGRNDYPQQKLDLVEAVQKSLDLSQLRAQKSDISLNFDYELPHAPIIANEVQIKQLMINLISNAIEELSELPDHRGRIDIYISEKSHYFEISVRDNGLGIENIPQVFTTHYSTKENGLGMGLAICRSIIEMHHGTILARNLDNGGAEFIVRLPSNIDQGQPPDQDQQEPSLDQNQPIAEPIESRKNPDE